MQELKDFVVAFVNVPFRGSRKEMLHTLSSRLRLSQVVMHPIKPIYERHSTVGAVTAPVMSQWECIEVSFKGEESEKAREVIAVH